MSGRVSSFSTVKMNNYSYIFILGGFNDYVTPLNTEIQRQFEPFGEHLGTKGLVVQPYASAKNNTFTEVVNKKWEQNIKNRFNKETYPFMLIINVDFITFDPSQHPWGIIWFSDYEGHPEKVINLLQKLGNNTKTNQDVFAYLKCVASIGKFTKFAKYFELKPKIFGISIDSKAILEDVKC